MTDDELGGLYALDAPVEKDWRVTQALLGTLSSDVGEAVIAASVPHWFDKSVLAALLKKSENTTTEICRELEKLPIVKRFGSLGAVVHDLTRIGVLSYLLREERRRFVEYTRRAQNIFQTSDDAQFQVEATYHEMALNTGNAVTILKRQIAYFDRKGDFSAVNNLLRYAEELVGLKVLDASVEDEIRSQQVQITSDLARSARAEKSINVAGSYLREIAPLVEEQYDSSDIESIDPERAAQIPVLPGEAGVARTGETTKGREILVDREIRGGGLPNVDPVEKQHGLAFEAGESTLEPNTNDIGALRNLGDEHRRAGRLDKALAALNRAIELGSNHAEALGSRAETYRQLGRYDEALRDFDRAIEIGPERAWALAQRGETHRQAGRYGEALADFTKAIELDPAYAWALA